MDSINFAERKKKKKHLLPKELYFVISSLLVIQRKQPPVDRVESWRDPGSSLAFHHYSDQATVPAAISFLNNKVNGTASVSKWIVGINPLL